MGDRTLVGQVPQRGATAPRPRRRRSVGGRVVRSRFGGVVRWAVPRLVVGMSHAVFRSCRFQFIDKHHEDQFLDRGRPIIFAGWHEGMLLLPYHFRDRRGGVVMVSPSRDGDLIADTIARFGLAPVRGSSGRDGAEALGALVAAVRARSVSAGIIVDGPKGPPLVAKTGAVALARATGLPIVPGAWWPACALRVGSWDRTLVPAPFSRIAFAFAAPLWVEPEASTEAIDRARTTLTERLLAARRVARQAVGGATPG
jgi:lysophospholipid acyltransferase (LPLAT)-like uncharacterized protein